VFFQELSHPFKRGQPLVAADADNFQVDDAGKAAFQEGFDA
jgi:hypothetical protein